MISAKWKHRRGNRAPSAYTHSRAYAHIVTATLWDQMEGLAKLERMLAIIDLSKIERGPISVVVTGVRKRDRAHLQEAHHSHKQTCNRR